MGRDEKGQKIEVDKEDPQLNPRLRIKKGGKNAVQNQIPILYPGPNPREFGVAQGLPTSPLLAILVLE